MFAPIVFVMGFVVLMFMGLKYGGPEPSDYVFQYLWLDYFFVSFVFFIVALINRIIPGILRGKIIIILIISAFIGYFSIDHWFEAKEQAREDKIQAEKDWIQKEQEEKEKRKEKEKNDLIAKLSKLGYTSKGKCYDNRNGELICYANDEYEIVYEGYNRVSFSKLIDVKNAHSENI